MSHRLTWKKPPVLPSVLTLCGSIVLAGLGTWQINKYFDKTRYHAQHCSGVEVAGNSASDTIGAIDTIPIEQGFDDLSGLAPRSRCLFGLDLIGRLAAQDINLQIPVGPRVHNGVSGYHIYMPISGADGSRILVNMGWSAGKSLTFSEAFSDPIDVQRGGANTALRDIQMTGSLAAAPRRNMFTLANAPEAEDWFHLDLAEIATHYRLEEVNMQELVYAQTITPDIFKDFTPATLSKLYLQPETHLQYAAFWYFMALALWAVFILRFVLLIRTS
ncbi:MAG: SURF1 family protein [Alphaproteobacteria bacterium]